jgi:membrane protein implicated in regulation of membrane protease activity
VDPLQRIAVGADDLRTLALGMILLICGLLTLLSGGVVMTAIGIAPLGLAAVTLVSLIFLMVGESEDRHRLRHPRG